MVLFGVLMKRLRIGRERKRRVIQHSFLKSTVHSQRNPFSNFFSPIYPLTPTIQTPPKRRGYIGLFYPPTRRQRPWLWMNMYLLLEERPTRRTTIASADFTDLWITRRSLGRWQVFQWRHHGLANGGSILRGLSCLQTVSFFSCRDEEKVLIY